MDDKVLDAVNRLAQINRLSMEEFRDAIIETLCELTHSTIAYFYAADYSERYLTLLGYSKQVMASCSMSIKRPIYAVVDTGLWGNAVRERRGIITNDYVGSTAPNKRGLPEGHVALTRHMNAPIFQNGSIVALVGVGNKPTPYTEQDLQNITDLMTVMWDEFEQALWEAVW
mgnify:CR=1 FL=1